MYFNRRIFGINIQRFKIKLGTRDILRDKNKKNLWFNAQKRLKGKKLISCSFLQMV